MQQWSEENSRQFLSFAEIITPSRAEQRAMISRLIPAGVDEPFRVVELGCGGGELSAAILQRFPTADYLGLDGSSVMLETAARRLSPFGERVQLQPFRLEELERWPALVKQPVRAVVSSLVIHHLEHAQKAALYRLLYSLLEPGGALVLADLVLPSAPGAVVAIAANWDEAAREQSRAATGSDETFRQFKDEGWNYYTDPDPMDKPASLFDQLQWLAEIGFRHVDCFWQRGGHAIYGGYK
ncbi:MAG TPA: class I SAM-dependent methyltransferase [Symbiobacteriaceae bacterium]|nr:class I SAM-dependent methyltransferase [Symbiobacteriaceae bacterium]